MNDADSLGLQQRIQLGFRVLKIAAQVRPAAIAGFFLGAALEIGSFLISIYATAKLSSLLAKFITTGQTDYIWFWLWFDLGSVVITGLGFLAMEYYKRILYFSFVRWSINNFLGAISKLDIQDFYNTDIRNQVNKIGTAYIWQMPELASAILDLAYGIARFLAITALVAQIAWWVVPVIAVFLIPSLLAGSKMARLQWFVWDMKGDTQHIFWGLEYMIRQAVGQMELRSLQAKKFALNKIDAMNKSFYEEQESRYRGASRILVPTKILEAAGTALGAIVLLKQLLSHSISLERYFFLSGALLRIGGALNTVFSTVSRMQENMLMANSYFQLIDREPQVVDSQHAVALQHKQAPHIRFENVSFQYPGENTPVIANFSLEIKPGEHVALVGENGAGKTTLIKLLMRFYIPTEGRILIDGHDLQDIAIESWYGRLATLFQDFNKYPLSIGENISIGRSGEKLDAAMLKAAGEFGGVNSIVNNYPHGWDTVLNASFEKGIEPSGGQWQRVALARAFYRNADLIVLDEPTSAIDARAEYEIFNNIFKQYKDKTALIISHRFSTVRRADRIIVLEQGKVMEEGSHSHLMKLKGLYYDMFSKQAEGYR